MVVGMSAGEMFLVVKHTSIIAMDNFEPKVGQPFGIFAFMGLVEVVELVAIDFGIMQVSIIVVVADTTSTEFVFVGRIVGPILEFGNIAGRMGMIVVVDTALVERSHKSMRL